LQFHKKNQNY